MTMSVVEHKRRFDADLIRMRRRASEAMAERVARRALGLPEPRKPGRKVGQTDHRGSRKPAAPPARDVSPVVSPMVLAAPQSLEAAKLRKLGWSLPGLSRRYGVTQAVVAATLGIQFEREW